MKGSERAVTKALRDLFHVEQLGVSKQAGVGGRRMWKVASDIGEPPSATGPGEPGSPPWSPSCGT